MERDSVPEELDEITRRLKQLEIEREAIKRENDTDKIAQLDKEIAELKDQETSFKAKWEGEKNLVNKIQQDKEEIEHLKFEPIGQSVRATTNVWLKSLFTSQNVRRRY